MTYVKKIKDEWQPQEKPGLRVGDVFDFPGSVDQLIVEGNVLLCDELGNEISTYDTLGMITERELEEFRAWRKLQGQESLKKSLEKEHDELLAEAKKLKEASKTEETPEDKKKAWGKKMAEARAKKKAQK